MEEEFRRKTFRQCAEIIIGDPKDKEWTDKQIDKLCELHHIGMGEAYKSGYIDGSLAVYNGTNT